MARRSVSATPRKCTMSSAVTTQCVSSSIVKNIACLSRSSSSWMASRHLASLSHAMSGDAKSANRVAGNSNVDSSTFRGRSSASSFEFFTLVGRCSTCTRPTVSAALGSSTSASARAPLSYAGSRGFVSSSSSSREKHLNSARMDICAPSVVGSVS